MKITTKSTNMLCLLLIPLAIQACSSTINCKFISDPAGAVIYSGKSPNRMSPIGKTPHTITYSGLRPYWKNWYYQFKKQGYYDSEIIIAEELPVNTNRKVWAKLEINPEIIEPSQANGHSSQIESSKAKYASNKSPRELLMEKTQELSAELGELNEQKKSFKKDEADYNKTEIEFLEKLSNKQLMAYSEFTEAINEGNNRAKMVLLYRKLVSVMTKEQSQDFVDIFTKRTILDEKRKMINEKDKSLSEYRERLFKVAQLIQDSERLNKPVFLPVRELKNNNLDSLKASLEKLQNTFEKNAARFREMSRHRDLMNSLRGIENAIRGY